MSKKTIMIVACLIILAAASRLVKHPANLTPIAAIALFGGWYFNKKSFIAVPLMAMLASDIFIGLYDWRLMASVYLGITLTFFIGWFLKKNPSWLKVLLGSVSGSIIFFVLTNLAVWAFYPWYAHTWTGLANCFAMGLPFLKNTLAGDLVYGVALFGSYEVVQLLVSQKQKALVKI